MGGSSGERKGRSHLPRCRQYFFLGFQALLERLKRVSDSYDLNWCGDDIVEGCTSFACRAPPPPPPPDIDGSAQKSLRSRLLGAALHRRSPGLAPRCPVGPRGLGPSAFAKKGLNLGMSAGSGGDFMGFGSDSEGGCSV